MAAEQRLERLVHERETMGAVNLRAEEEAAELETGSRWALLRHVQLPGVRLVHETANAAITYLLGTLLGVGAW